MYTYENFEKNILKPRFFLDTIQIFQRGDIKKQQEQLNFLFKLKKEKLEKEEEKEQFNTFIDQQIIKEFLENKFEKQILTDIDINQTIEEFLEDYFLRKDKFDKYLLKFYEYNEFSKFINNFFQFEKKIKTKEELITFLNDKTILFKTIFNKENKNKIEHQREYFSLDKTNIEQYSRIKKIFDILISKNIEEKVFLSDFKLFLSGLSKDILKEYSIKIEDISFLNLKEQILKVSEQTQQIAILFNDIKKGNEFQNHILYNKIENIINNNSAKKEIEQLNSLNGKSLESRGNDFFIRLYSKLILMDESLEKDSIKSKRRIWTKENINNSKLNNNANFRKECRENIVTLIRNSPFKTNIKNYSRSFILDKFDFPNIPEFAYPEEIKNNPYNISIQGDISKDNNINFQILLMILETTENKGEIYPFENKDIKTKIDKLYKNSKISSDFLQKSLMDIINYELFLKEKYPIINNKIISNENINIKKEIDFNLIKPKFKDFNIFVNFVKNLYKLNKINSFKEKEQLIKKIKLFNGEYDINIFLNILPLKQIENLNKLTDNDIEIISNLNLSIINYYEEKQINDLLLEQKSINLFNNLNNS